MDMMSYLMGRNSGSAKKGAKIEVVTELPETGEANVIYLVPKQDEDENNVFDEYIWINDDWELIGTTDIDLSNYYTKSEVDGKLPPIYVLNTTNQLIDGNGGQTLESDAKIRYSEIITDAYAKGYKNIAILLCSTSSGKAYMFYSNAIISTSSAPDFYADCTFKDHKDMDVIVRRWINGYGTWNNGVFTLSGSLTYDVEKKNLLYSNNSTAYTPTGAYNPATKKYVDDAVASAGGGAPAITISLSQVVSQSPLTLAMTSEQQAILENDEYSNILFDGSALGMLAGFAAKTETSSNRVTMLIQAPYFDSTTYDMTRVINYLGVYDKTSHNLIITQNKQVSDLAPVSDIDLANKKYVDDAVADCLNIPTLVLSTIPTRNWNGGSLSSPQQQEIFNFFANRINEMLTENPKNGFVIIKYEDTPKEEIWVFSDTLNTTSTMFRFYILNNATIHGSGMSTYEDYMYSIRGFWDNGVFVCNNITCFKQPAPFVTSGQVLTKTNYDSYTPMSNYHPSTKLYTDLAVAKASGLLPYATNKTYQLGDYVYRSATDPTLYKCKVANTTGSWNSANWDQKTYMNYLSDTLVGNALGGSF